MKTWIIVLALAAFPTQALAAGHSQTSEPDTLFNGDIESGGYGAPVLKYAGIGNYQEVFVGGRGGWVINHQFVLGGAGYGMATNYPISGDRLTFGYGGVLLEYIIEPDALFHVSVDTVIGGGAVAPKSSTHPDGVFVAEPEINGILNLSRSVRAGLGLAYRLTRGVSVAGLNNSDLSGVNGTFFLAFGSF
jgi:hypothetical protein